MATKQKNPAPRWAIIGLIVALLGCISTGLLGLLQGVITLQIYTPSNPETITLALQISVAVMIVGLAAYVLMVPETVRRFLSGRQARYGSNSLIMILAFLGIIFVVNYLAFQNPCPWEDCDVTEDQSNTLAPETLQALATLPGKVNAVAFYSTNLPTDTAEDLLRDFKANSNGKFDYQFINPDLDPLAAREAGITGDGKIMLLMGEQREIASTVSENELTRTLIRLISPEERVIYFLGGHGEGSLEGGGEISYSIAKRTLESKNYTVNTLNLLADKTIPEGATTLVIPGPQKPLSDAEVTALKKFVDEGGSLVVMQDPTVITDFGESPDPLAEYLASDWGITLDNDIILDLSTQQALNAISASYNQHAITQNLSANYAVIMPQARSVSVTKELEGVTAVPLISTSANSWGETNFTSAQGEQINFDEGVDLIGPLHMAVAAENSTTKGRVVVFGNSVFVSDQLFDAYGNGNIFINSVDWAAEQDDLINITPRTPVQRIFTLPTNPNAQLIMVGILIFSIFILPGLVLVAGVSSWISRRRQG